MDDIKRCQVLLALSNKSSEQEVASYLESNKLVFEFLSDHENLLSSIERINPVYLVLDEDVNSLIKPLDICAVLKTKSKTRSIKIIYLSKALQSESNFFDKNIVKPLLSSELVSKIKSMNSISFSNKNRRLLIFDNIEMNVDSFKVTKFGKQIHLGPTEFRILQCFMEAPKKILSRDYLIRHVWGFNSEVEPRTIDVHINRLRTVLKDFGSDETVIRTIRAAGYSLHSVNEFSDY